MDKNKIKSFAIWARRSLIAQVSEKANRIGIYEDKILEATAVQGGFKLEDSEEIFAFLKKDRDALVSQVREKGFEQVMEEVAYTWFNRFMGLRYMEVNDYLPSGVRILSSEVEGKKEPDVLTKVSEIIDELELNANEIYDLLDTGNTLDREKAYRIILVKQCNELGKIIPQMFEKISDYTELLLPDNLLEEGSVIRKMVGDIEESDWLEEVEIIGWMYQYYISEKKDEVFAALKKNVKITKENIPAATQLFTPKWIVKYMVENSLGRLWLEGHPNEELQKEWKYYLEEAEQEPEVEEELQKIRGEYSRLTPEDIKVLDPCMGSGHMLVYAFDVLYEIYKSAGYSEREIPKLILKNNLYGLDIDDRAAQLASFALIMKARHYNRRLFREIERDHLELNLCSIQESNEITDEVIEYFANGNEELKEDVKYLVDVFIEAKEYGSILEVKRVKFDRLKERLSEIENDNNLIFGDYRKMLLERLYVIIKQAEIMSSKYEVCVTNPPYMGNRNMDKKLVKFLDNKFKDTKRDLYATFIKRNFDYIYKNGFSAIVTMHTWMFLSAFESLRKDVIKKRRIINLLHLDNNLMGIAFKTSVSIFGKTEINSYKTTFKFVDNASKFSSINKRDNILKVKKLYKISGAPIAYWLADSTIQMLANAKKFDDFIDLTGSQHVTGNNEKYLRYKWEVSDNDIGKKWIGYAKGGAFRRWYGNDSLLVDWSDEALNFYKNNKSSNLLAEKYLYRYGITWSATTNGGYSCRVLSDIGAFDKKGPALFINNTKYYKYFMGFLNSKVAQYFLDMYNDSQDYQNIDIKRLPVVKIKENIVELLNNIVSDNINLVSENWSLDEVSYYYKGFSKYMCNTSIYESYKNVISRQQNDFRVLKKNEESINRLFINMYGLNDEIEYTVRDKDISIKVFSNEEFGKKFISYTVGCMLGRYSIDSEGLIYAGGYFNDKWNFETSKVRKIEKDDEGNIISDSWIDSRFMPDKENIIPITEDEYFEDDIVSRFIEFIRIVYGNDTLEENLDFIADSIGRKSSETSRQAIRRYFIKDFYKDHLKIYQKRPIYWMFESGKNNGFKCLIYMHRYNEQTVAKVRTDYLHILQRKYEAEINRLQLVVDSEEYTAKDRTVAKKKIDRISKQIEECREYDQVVADLANEKISIDLDDGVKVNYAKFQDVKVINSKGKEVKMNLLSKI